MPKHSRPNGPPPLGGRLLLITIAALIVGMAFGLLTYAQFSPDPRALPAGVLSALIAGGTVFSWMHSHLQEW